MMTDPSLPADWTTQDPVDEAGDASRILAAVAKYKDLGFVPYVWGGNQIGTKAECQACRACIAGKKRLKVERRLKACSACQKCGIDCSHFSNRVYADAGLKYPYASTSDLTRMAPARLSAELGLVDMGRDIALAQPGDILLYPHHVVILLKADALGRGSVLHVSRSVTRKGVGGIEVISNEDLRHFRGRLLKILRHQKMIEVHRPVPRFVTEPGHPLA